MENLNAKKIYKELTMFVEDMPTDLHLGFKRTVKFREFLKDTLALIKSYEEQIFALENRLKECENGYEGTLFLDMCKLHDAEEKVKELKAENDNLFARNLELSEKGEKVVLAYKKLSEENERLRGILLEFTDIVHKWGNKYGYDTSEISLVPILNEGSAIKKQIEADTLEKYKTAIIEYYSKPNYQPTKEHPIKHTQIEKLFAVLDEKEKEILEGE